MCKYTLIYVCNMYVLVRMQSYAYVCAFALFIVYTVYTNGM